MKPDDATTLQPAGPRLAWVSREVRILSAVNFVSAVGFGIQSPTIPVFALQLGVGSAMVGLIIAAFAFGRTVTNVPAGRCIDRLGVRPVIAAGLVLLALGSVLAGLSQAGWQLTLFRGVCGVGSALYSVAAMALLTRSTAASHRGRVIGLYMGAFYVGATTGPALGATMAGWSPRVPFFVYGAGVALSALFVWSTLRGSSFRGAAPASVVAGAATSLRAQLLDGLRLPAFRAAMLCNFGTGWASYGVRVSVLPLFLLQGVHADAQWIGLALALGALVQAGMLPVAGTVTDLLGRRPALIAGQVLMTAAYGAVLVWPTLWAYLACFVIIAVGTALCVTAGSALTGDIARERPGGASLMGLHAMAADVGTMAGAVLAGALAQHLSYPTALAATMAVTAAGAVSAGRLQARPADPGSRP